MSPKYHPSLGFRFVGEAEALHFLQPLLWTWRQAPSTAQGTKHAQEAGDTNPRLPEEFEPTAPMSHSTPDCWGEATRGAGARPEFNKREPRTADQPQNGERWDFSEGESPGTASWL